jgi:hypothetical protein
MKGFPTTSTVLVLCQRSPRQKSKIGRAGLDSTELVAGCARLKTIEASPTRLVKLTKLPASMRESLSSRDKTFKLTSPIWATGR